MSEEKKLDPQNPGESGLETGENVAQENAAEKATQKHEGVEADANSVAVDAETVSDVSETVADSECCSSEEQKPTIAELEQQLREQSEALARLESEKKELTDRLLRLQADFDNFRRRTRAEAANLADAANAKVFTELLPIIDNLERAVAVEGVDKAFQEGVAMVLRQFLTTLERMGVVPIQAVGEEFDPTKHEAVMQVEATEEFPSGTVVEVVQKGYLFKDKVLRPSMVKVAG